MRNSYFSVYKEPTLLRCISYRILFSQARLQGPRCELVEEEGPRGADEQFGEQAVQDVQRLRLRLLQRQRAAHRGQQVQGLSAPADDLVVSSSRSCKQ